MLVSFAALGDDPSSCYTLQCGRESLSVPDVPLSHTLSSCLDSLPLPNQSQGLYQVTWMCPNNWSFLTLHQHLLYTNLFSDHLIFWSASSVPSVAFHFKDQQVLHAGTAFAAESRIKNKHFSSKSRVEPQETPAALLIYFKATELHAPDLFSLQPLQSNRPLWWNLSEDEIVQHSDVLLLNFCLCCSLYSAGGDQWCPVPLAENTDACPQIIQPLFRGPWPVLEPCYSPAERFQLFTCCWLSWQNCQLCELSRKSRRRALRGSSSFCPLPIIILRGV